MRETGQLEQRFALVAIVGERLDDLVFVLEIVVDRAVAETRTRHDVGQCPSDGIRFERNTRGRQGI